MSLIPKGFYGEEYSDEVAFIIKPEKVLGEVISKYQKSSIIKTKTFGRVVLQDDLIFLADRGNEAIAEMYTHIPMLSGEKKKRVLLIGAGDGAGVERFLKYPELEKIVAIDIDKDFVELAKKHMKDHTKSFKDPRVELIYKDGARYLAETDQVFDVIAVTVGDPFTISKTMFNKEFLKDAYLHLSEGGIISMDGYMPYYTHEDCLNYWDIFQLVSESFPIVRIAQSTSPLMPGGLCTFIFGSKNIDMSKEPKGKPPCKTVWYNNKIHTASFVLPEFVKNKLVRIKGFVQ